LIVDLGTPPVTVEKDAPLEGQALWDDVAKEREAGDQPPSDTQVAADTTADTEEQKTELVEEAKTDGSQSQDTSQEADPYAGLSPALKLRLEKLESFEQQLQQLPQLTSKVDAAVGRVAAWQREKDVAKQASAAVKQASDASTDCSGFRVRREMGRAEDRLS
jgi:hypothetical protein